jgi:acetoin utilization deacetylase AcuC-like enzyme
MLIYTSDAYPVQLPQGHRFPMRKYPLIREQLIYEGYARPHQFLTPAFIPEALILGTHDAAYWQQVKDLALDYHHARRIGFPQSPAHLRRSLSSVSATFHSTRQALATGLGMSTSGGTHHAFRDRGEGFCTLNDVAISANHFLRSGALGQLLVIDLDVHQGNGTARLFQQEPRVFTFSLHCRDNFPHRKEQSDWDVALPAGTGDKPYLAEVEATVPELVQRLRPDLIFYIAGTDILATDKLGKFALSRAGCRQRDQIVVDTAYRQGVPLVIVMGGGYSPRIPDVVAAHTNTFKVALSYYA